MRVDPKKMRDDLCRNASARKVESLQLIYQICEEQKARGSRDYSVVTIGRLSNERGGPSAAAIRNKPGGDYRALIKVFADSVDGFSKKHSKAARDPVDDILEGVTDPVLRARINLLLAEMRSLRAQLLAMRHLVNQSAVLEVDRPDNPPRQPLADGSDIDQILNAQEIEALDMALKPAALEHWGWKLDKAGRVLTDTGQVVFRAGFATALQKTIQATKAIGEA